MARSAVSGQSRLPSPPASTMPSTLAVKPFGTVVTPQTLVRSPAGEPDGARDGLPCRSAHRPAHPRVPPGRLRRSGGARRAPGAGPACARGRRGALLRGAARRRPGRARAPPAQRAGRRERRAADARGRPVHGRGRRGRRPRPLPHLVRQHGRAPGQDPLRRPARGHGALARAAPAVEGRAARRRVPAVVVGGTHVLRARRCGDRGERGDAARRAGVLSGPRPSARPRGAQRHRHGVLPPRPGPRRRARRRRRPGPAERGVRRAHHPAEGPGAPGRGRAPHRPRRPDRAVRRGAGHPGDRRGDRDRGRRAECGPSRRDLGAGDAGDRRGPSAAVGGHRLRLPVGLRTAGHRQPGGDGVRHGRGRLRRRRHPRGRRARWHRAAGALRRARRGGVPHAGSPRR